MFLRYAVRIPCMCFVNTILTLLYHLVKYFCCFIAFLRVYVLFFYKNKYLKILKKKGAVKISKQGVYHKNIPKVLHQSRWFHILLFFYGIHNVCQFCSASSRLGIQNGIFYGAEVKQPVPAFRKIPACTYHLHFSAYFIGSKQGFLCLDANHVKDTACDMLTDTTVRIGQLCGLHRTRRWKLKHILSSVIFHCNLLSVSTIVCPS